MILLIFILLFIPTTSWAQTIYVKPHIVSKTEMAVFHDLTSAHVWSEQYHGKIILEPNSTYVVVYQIDELVSTPDDWMNTQ